MIIARDCAGEHCLQRSLVLWLLQLLRNIQLAIAAFFECMKP